VMARNRKVEKELSIASGAFQAVVDAQFDLWELSPSEREVALLSIKGISIADIAGMRATKAGTVKAQSAAIYRKAGVANRTELLSAMVEELIHGLEVDNKQTDHPARLAH
jgi:DNA-binding NarL/FixJ family response regulator